MTRWYPFVFRLAFLVVGGAFAPICARADDCRVGIIETVASLNMVCRAAAVGPDGSIYVGDGASHRIVKVLPDEAITTLAGNGERGYSGDGGPATEASLNHPQGVAVGEDGSVYIADTHNHRVRRVDPAGIITTVAGNGKKGYSGDGGPATEARLDWPARVAVGPDGSLYIAGSHDRRIRQVDPAGVITTVAGNGERGYSGDGGPAIEAKFDDCGAMAVGADGSLYIADDWKAVVRKVDPAGIITTVAGSGTGGYSGDDGRATQAELCGPTGLAKAPDGSLYIGDTQNQRVRKVDPAGIITTVAGNGWPGGLALGRFSGDGGLATQASLSRPMAVALGPDGSLYIADSENHRIRKVRWFPCEPEAAKAAADDLRAEAGDSPIAWRQAAELYAIAEAWEEAAAAAERALALTPETDEAMRMSAEMLVARVYVAKRDDHEGRRRLIRVLAGATDPVVLHEAADALVELHLRRGERDQAIATLNDLRLRTQDDQLRRWVNQRLKEIAGD